MANLLQTNHTSVWSVRSGPKKLDILVAGHEFSAALDSDRHSSSYIVITFFEMSHGSNPNFLYACLDGAPEDMLATVLRETPGRCFKTSSGHNSSISVFYVKCDPYSVALSGGPNGDGAYHRVITL
ncbi:predicted protein [Coccidioides posadasii str. Silveira]|uniref:Predicted protein n=1 Tax=Coccidioides posadasii (strain RMSCC 757 / Silveira) TaxID=443226 RepID=E9CR06_COCPS|nr:predicted protein [Coccidioides posadasii str. Silveira]